MKQKSSESQRIKREKNTLKAMIRIYCQGKHSDRNQLCQECKELLKYALVRLDRCPFGASKPACNKCFVHCYKTDMRERIRAVMRYTGPRMFLPHPLLSLLHILDKWRRNQSYSKKNVQTHSR